MKSEKDQSFNLWCVVELFGHVKVAGKCTEQNIAGTNMLRVDVPKTSKHNSFTRFYSSNAIYAIHPVTEEFAVERAESFCEAPIDVWDIRQTAIKLKLLESKPVKSQSDGFYNEEA